MYRILLISSFALFSTISGFAQVFPDQPDGYVNDYARFLNSSEVSRLQQKLANYRDTTSNVIVITTLQSLEGFTVDDIAGQMFNKWRMWEGERQNGILILLSRQERDIRIEVGYGLEGAVPDILAGRVVREVLIPQLQSGNYFEAFDRATDILMQLAAGEYEALPPRASTSDEPNVRGFLLLIFIIVMLILISKGKRGGGGHHIRRGDVIVMGTPGFGRHGYGGGFSGGGFGGGRSGGFGGFSGGGGFGSGGGGASGRW